MVVSDGERDYDEKDELPSDFDEVEENGFSIGERLVAPSATMYTTADLHSMHFFTSTLIFFLSWLICR